MSCKGHFQKLYSVMAEICENMTDEQLKTFAEVFDKKLEELRNEQATNLQEDTGASR